MTVGGTRAIRKMMESAFENPFFGGKLLEAQGVNPRSLSEVAPIDDEIPPLPPTGLTVTPHLQSLHVEVDNPPTKDYVTTMRIEYTPLASGDADVIDVPGTTGYSITGLEYIDYVVRVKFIDEWGLQSDWTMPVTVKPLASADFYFDAEEARQRGNLTNLIDSISTSLLQGENFAENSVRAVALAQPDSSNLLPMIETDFEQWPDDMLWPPIEADTAGNLYVQAFIPAGFSAKIDDRNGLKWLAVSRGVSTSDSGIVPFSKFKQRGTFPNENYIYSIFVDGPAGSNVRLTVEGATNESGVGRMVVAQSAITTLDSSSGGQRIWIRFSLPPTHPFLRLKLEGLQANTTTYWSRLQLERAGNKMEPSPWGTGVVSAGVVSARSMLAIDLAAANALFKDAVIESGKIVNLTADKIEAGTLQAGEIFVETLLHMATGTGGTGEIRCGVNTVLDSNGLRLKAQSSNDTPVLVNDSKITDETNKSAMAFYQTDIFNGIILRSDGFQAGDRDGAIALHATEDGVLGGSTPRVPTSSAKIEALSQGTGVFGGNGQVVLYWDVFAQNDMNVRNELKGVPFEGNNISSGGTAAASHPYGHKPHLIFMQYNNGTDWVNATEPDFKIVALSTTIQITNNMGNAKDIRGIMLG